MATPTTVPKHFWVVAILALLWNAFGCLDYVMTETNNEAWLGSFTPEQRAYFRSFPAWAVAGWALGVWSGLLGSILLLARKRLAIPLFILSLVGMAVGFIYQLAISDGIRIMGPASVIAPIVIVILGIALLVYARKMAARGVLR